MRELADGPCDCPWLDPADEALAGGTALCGCGERHARLYRDTVVHWEGKHWVLECAFAEARRRLESREERGQD